MPSKAPEGHPPFAHTLLGFKTWKELVEAPQPDGLGWSAAYERAMWNGWRKAREAGITPERIDELGHRWLADVGLNREKRMTGHTLSDQAEQDLQRKKMSKDERKRDRRVHSEGSVPKAEAKRVVEEVAPNLRPSDAKRVIDAALDRLEPEALDDVARRIVPSVEADTLKGILADMIAKLDEEELEKVVVLAARRLASSDKKRLARAFKKIMESD